MFLSCFDKWQYTAYNAVDVNCITVVLSVKRKWGLYFYRCLWFAVQKCHQFLSICVVLLFLLFFFSIWHLTYKSPTCPVYMSFSAQYRTYVDRELRSSSNVNLKITNRVLPGSRDIVRFTESAVYSHVGQLWFQLWKQRQDTVPF